MSINPNPLIAMTIQACVSGLDNATNPEQEGRYLKILRNLAEELARGEEAFQHPGAKAQPSELEMHRADYQACKAAGWESPGELLSAYNTLMQTKEALLAERDALIADIRHAAAKPAAKAMQPWTNAQMVRLYHNSTDIVGAGACNLSMPQFKQLCVYIEKCHGIRED